MALTVIRHFSFTYKLFSVLFETKLLVCLCAARGEQCANYRTNTTPDNAKKFYLQRVLDHIFMDLFDFVLNLAFLAPRWF